MPHVSNLLVDDGVAGAVRQVAIDEDGRVRHDQVDGGAA